MMLTVAAVGEEVAGRGFAIAEGVLSRATVEHLLTSLEHIGDTGSVRKRGGIFAVRNLLDASPEVRELAHSEEVRALVEPVLGIGSFLSGAFCSTRSRTRTGRFPGTRT